MDKEPLYTTHSNLHRAYILLVSEKEEASAQEAYDAGIIDQYLRRDDVHFKAKLNRTIFSLQRLYFYEQTNKINNSSEAAYLSSDQFLDLFDAMWLDDQYVEFYCLDQNGSILFLTPTGELTWLIVQHKQAVKQYADLLKKENVLSPDLLAAVFENKKIPYCFGKSLPNVLAQHIENYLHPSKSLDEQFCYATIYGDANNWIDAKKTQNLSGIFDSLKEITQTHSYYI